MSTSHDCTVIGFSFLHGFLISETNLLLVENFQSVMG